MLEKTYMLEAGDDRTPQPAASPIMMEKISIPGSPLKDGRHQVIVIEDGEDDASQESSLDQKKMRKRTFS